MAIDNNKSLGRDFVQRLRSKSHDVEAFKAIVNEFSSGPLDNRVAVAMSLLAIGADESERVFDRNYALSQLAFVVRLSGLRNNKDLQGQLIGIIDGWLAAPGERPQRQSRLGGHCGHSQGLIAKWVCRNAMNSSSVMVSRRLPVRFARPVLVLNG